LNIAKNKCADFHILERIKSTTKPEIDELDNIEFEEVPSQPFENTTNNNIHQKELPIEPEIKYHKPTIPKFTESNSNVTTKMITPTNITIIPEKETKEDLLNRAPILPAESYTLYWGEESISMNTGIETGHRFFGERSADNEIPTSRFNDLLLRHTITKKEFVPVEWACRAPLKNGKLCQRYDRHICPFHGTVIPRDKNGQPNEKSESTNETTAVKENIVLDSINSKEKLYDHLLAQHKRKFEDTATTTKSNKKLKKEPPTNLINIKKSTNTPRKRIHDKLLNTKTNQNVAAHLSFLENLAYHNTFRGKW